MAARTAAFSALGGGLFGLDVGYISGVQEMPSFHASVNGGLPLEPDVAGIVVASFAVGAMVSSSPPVAGSLGRHLGGRRSILFGGVLFCAGSLLQGLANGLVQFVVGRAISGGAVGMLSTYVPLYQSEISEPCHRGALVALYQLAITAGVAIAFWINLAVREVPDGWRISVLCQCAPGALLTSGMACMPDSPRWLLQVGRPCDARTALMQIRPAGAGVELELAEMVAAAEREAGERASWFELFLKATRRTSAIGVVLQLLQQLCGMNVFMYYGPKVFKALSDPSSTGEGGGLSATLQFTLILGVVNLLATIPAVFLVDRYGRIPLLRVSALGMGASCLVLGVLGNVCVQNRACSLMAIGATFTFVVSFELGWGPVTWIYCSEIFPTRLRAKGVGLTTMSLWLGNFLVSYLPPLLIEALGYSTFFIFGGFCAACWLAATWLPETKGRSAGPSTLLSKAPRSRAPFPSRCCHTVFIALPLSLAPSQELGEHLGVHGRTRQPSSLHGMLAVQALCKQEAACLKGSAAKLERYPRALTSRCEQASIGPLPEEVAFLVASLVALVRIGYSYCMQHGLQCLPMGY
jgi:sugar porter (SP) family MFS transporter